MREMKTDWVFLNLERVHSTPTSRHLRVGQGAYGEATDVVSFLRYSDTAS